MFYVNNKKIPGGISILFDRDWGVISRHINNIFKEGELRRDIHFMVYRINIHHFHKWQF